MKNRRCWTVLALALASLLALTALGLTGCGKDDGKGGAADPEDVVESFFEALEDQDISAIMELIEPGELEELQDDLGSGYKSDLKDYFFDWMPDDAAFKGLKYDTDVDGAEAEVEVARARVVYEDEYGDEVSVDVATSDEPIAFELVKGKNGWYLSTGSFRDIDEEDASFSDAFAYNYEDYDYDDYDDYDDDDYDSGTSEADVVEAAMLAYLKANSVEGLEFVLRDLQINGNEAVGVFECTNMDLEWPMVYMQKGSSGWYGVNVGTGFEPPSWYDWNWAD